MSKVLYIQASPRKTQSNSIAVADAFIDAYRQHQSRDEVVKLNLFERQMPTFDGNTLQAKYAILHGQKPSNEQKAEWRVVEEMIAEFTSADKYVLAVPMWNFAIPYRLKHYIDILVQPGYTFSFSPEEGFSGLVKNRPVFVAYARGNAYPEGSEMAALDLQTRYMRTILNFIGLDDIREIIVEPTLTAPETAEANLVDAINRARDMAASF